MAAVALIIFAACTGNPKNSPVNVTDLLANAESLAGEAIIVEGLATHVCAKSGMKLFLQGDTGEQTIRIESNGSLGKFDPEAVNHTVRVWGRLVEERIDEAYCQQLEEEIRNNTLVSHGEGGSGCETEQKAEGVATGSSEMERLNDFRTRIAERKANDGKEYLSLYHVAADSYIIIR